MFMFKSGQAISQSADGLNVANRNSDAKSEDATTLQAGDGKFFSECSVFDHNVWFRNQVF